MCACFIKFVCSYTCHIQHKHIQYTLTDMYFIHTHTLYRYVRAHLSGDAVLKVSLPKKVPLLTLLSYFILCQPVSVKMAGRKNKTEQRPQPHSPLEELQVMMAVVGKIDEQSNVDQQFYMFEALFGGCIGTIRVSGDTNIMFLLPHIVLYMCTL